MRVAYSPFGSTRKAFNSMAKRSDRETRDRNRTLRVVVSATERATIEERAKDARLSVSAYLRSAGMGQRARPSRLDHAAVNDLARANADQGRLGGLLKMWLVDRPGRGAPEIEVRRLLDQIREMQGKLAEVAERL